MTQHEAIQKIDPILIESSIALLESYDVVAQCDGPVERAKVADEGIVAFIGLLGDTIRGSLVISAPAALIGKALPVSPGNSAVLEEEQRDWARELSNQLLGRLKLRLAMYGVHFDMSTPSAVMGRELRGFRASEGTHVLRFSSQEMTLYVEIDVLISPQFEMLDEPIAEAVSVQEGELLMLI